MPDTDMPTERLIYRVTEIDEYGKPVQSGSHPTGGLAYNQAGALELVGQLMEYCGAQRYRLHFAHQTPEDQASPAGALTEDRWTWDSDIVRTYNPEV